MNCSRLCFSIIEQQQNEKPTLQDEANLNLKPGCGSTCLECSKMQILSVLVWWFIHFWGESGTSILTCVVWTGSFSKKKSNFRSHCVLFMKLEPGCTGAEWLSRLNKVSLDTFDNACRPLSFSYCWRRTRPCSAKSPRDTWMTLVSTLLSSVPFFLKRHLFTVLCSKSWTFSPVQAHNVVGLVRWGK